MDATRLSAPARHVGANSNHFQASKCVRRATLWSWVLAAVAGFSTIPTYAEEQVVPFQVAVSAPSPVLRTELAFATPDARNSMGFLKEIANPKTDKAGNSLLGAAQLQRIKKHLVRTYKADPALVDAVVNVALEDGSKHGFDPLLLLAVIGVESRFDPNAHSSRGAQGLMQVIPRYHQDKLSGKNAAKNGLFDPVANVKVGVLVLKEGVARRGDLKGALAYYSGGRRHYAQEVLALRANFERVALLAEPDHANHTASAPNTAL